MGIPPVFTQLKKIEGAIYLSFPHTFTHLEVKNNDSFL